MKRGSHIIMTAMSYRTPYLYFVDLGHFYSYGIQLYVGLWNAICHFDAWPQKPNEKKGI